ncbi:MAG: fasciclin domain-containing protein [Bacteroidetes bacterium]|nr:fasciclin domain-containing protein [Bacteroidota bacterium]MBK9318084.1 fasciclin domain-containing protein [Bacteroidota bacterium]
MKKNKLFLGVLGMALTTMTILSGCGGSTGTETTTEATTEEAVADAGQSAVKDDESQKDVVKVAIGSKDHTTLVAAVQAAELVDVLSNAGPFTVFAPTNDAFNLLPAGTVDDLVKPENKEKLQDILQYHVAVAVYKPEMFRDGQVIGMANSGNITISVKDGKTMVNGKATILASVNASNGIIHVIDQVLLEEKK